MFEADALCDRISVINHGKIIARGTPEELKALVPDLTVVEMEVFGISPMLIEKIQRWSSSTAVAEDQGPRQLLWVQTALGAKAIPVAHERFLV